ncbi:Holliday junction resolvase RuvX [Marinospirillum alkaliphilum]|uniref:Putative pre-16S rRNA nuclease n=1 Tax=Marinospirillum alkaliphilum DSM 21637 TaxID=1122209 RepID=A0A1K1WP76_9GAMM|nr:Holliday junction resolvase RuvX [Marinospirillum alkaliphilum]SFX39200.1 putative holliday junction resolvase [Marinospirillum alkaliphilum DSM 21637]
MPDPVARRVMAFDFGSKRHGVAMGNELTRTANPLGVIPAKDGIPSWELLDALIREWQPDLFVVGLPLAEDGSETPLSQRARKFARRLFGRYGKACYGMDEHGTTRMAKAVVKQQGHRGNYREDPVDSLAAAMILEGWLALEPSTASPFLQSIAGPDFVRQ